MESRAPAVAVDAAAHPFEFDRLGEGDQGGMARPMPTVTAVIPTYNEERNLPHVLPRLPAMVEEVILVDGHSRDRTVEVAREFRPDVRVVYQSGHGKGNALACGFAEATGDIIVMLDADGSTDPTEIPRFVATLLTGAEFVKGSRFITGGGSADITPLRRAGNRALSRIVNFLFRTNYTDLCYGYTAFWRGALPALSVNCSTSTATASRSRP